MGIETILELAVFAVLMGLSAFFSSSETALFSLSRLQLERMRKNGHPRVLLIERLLNKPRHLIVTILIGNELVNVAASVISAAVVIQLLGADNKWINLLIMVPLLLLFGEITPKTLAIRNNIAFASFQCRFIELFARVITPLRWIVRHVSDFFITLIVGGERSPANIITEDLVRSLAREAIGDGVLDDEEALYINRIFDLGDKLLRDVMTPRSRIVSLPATTTVDEAALHYRRHGHTKVPVYSGSKDNVIGILYSRDLLEWGTGHPSAGPGAVGLSEIVREAYFTPDTKPVADLFYTLRKRKLSLALTIDEYGGVTGLVTMEDLLECIFGEILSRSELLLRRSMSLKRLASGAYQVDGATTIAQLNQFTGVSIDSEWAETVGGLLLHAFGELPAEGESVVIDGCRFSVVSMVERRIAEVTLEPAFDPGPPDADGYEPRAVRERFSDVVRNIGRSTESE
jgi:putative hemolysin